MATNHEIEFKQIITASLYETLQEKYFKNCVLFKQVNYYIDTPDFKLKQHRSALRIRVKDKQFEMTLKTPAEVGLMEYNHIISINPEIDMIIPNDSLPDDIRQILVKQFGVNDQSLSILGALTTYRQETQYQGDLLVLDKSEYLDTTDYELEFEVKDYDQGLLKFQSLLNEWNLEHKQPLNKVQRFFKKKETLSNNIN
ncbi:TPA: CYTH domain-containing protein [Staphylococcus argenteus]|uniref:CYTH domain-containing protein n=1 Tax=Staphylococcus argenteus TaxID=985002 RepID=UPI00050717E1|nr:CYTH domain-containing protein [Staphylococcus argenteus]MBE2135256.1 CYTH domain-containing protein [Staphylococcus argenteus]MDT3005762.1 CYTH domain-containing protein [Staphylococcus argenteus]UPO21728.1 CYTH domain-containing protein [Staphylococcus argenteus]CDR63084.1 adenylate cyclase family protein [Staphylococcus argenteus]HDY9444845.1 CYTH domain-containing protein [Staphylococcus argenteus]